MRVVAVVYLFAVIFVPSDAALHRLRKIVEVTNVEEDEYNKHDEALLVRERETNAFRSLQYIVEMSLSMPTNGPDAAPTPPPVMGTPAPTPAPVSKATPLPTPAPTPAPIPGSTPAPIPATTPAPTPAPVAAVTPAPTPGSTPAPIPATTPAPTPAPSPAPSPAPTPTQPPAISAPFQGMPPFPAPLPVMRDTPSPVQTVPPILLAREASIQEKCGVSLLERSDQILQTLSTVSPIEELENTTSSRGMAYDWLDMLDMALLCADDSTRLLQRYIVGLIYFQLGGPTWTVCSQESPECFREIANVGMPAIRWLTPLHECTWFGLGCDDAPDGELALDTYYGLTEIEVPDNNLNGEWPIELFNLTTLEVLTMDGNGAIRGSFPPEIRQMEMLRVIDVDSNALTGTLPEELFSLPRLTVLDMNSNQFVGTLSESIGMLSGLSIVQLYGNQFTGPVPTSGLLDLERLVLLALDQNQFTGSVEPLCEVAPQRRIDNNFTIYLRFFCVPPEVECSCCNCA